MLVLCVLMLLLMILKLKLSILLAPTSMTAVIYLLLLHLAVHLAVNLAESHQLLEGKMAKWGIQEKHFQRAPKFSNISVCRLGRFSRFRVDFGGKVGLFNVLYNFAVGVC